MTDLMTLNTEITFDLDDGNTTTGLEKVVDWDALEEGFEEGKFQSQQEFRDAVREQFGEEREFTRHHYEQVVAGLFPEYRDRLAGLPNISPAKRRSISSKVTADVVRDIRARAAQGARLVRLAEEYDIKPNTVSDIVKFRTWKEVA